MWRFPNNRLIPKAWWFISEIISWKIVPPQKNWWSLGIPPYNYTIYSCSLLGNPRLRKPPYLCPPSLEEFRPPTPTARSPASPAARADTPGAPRRAAAEAGSAAQAAGTAQRPRRPGRGRRWGNPSATPTWGQTWEFQDDGIFGAKFMAFHGIYVGVC